MLRRVIAILLGIVLLSSLGACGIKKKIGDKISEGVLEKVIGEGVDIDLEGDKVTIAGEDGEEFTFGDTEWPKGKAVDSIPEFKHGKIVSVMNSDQACMINIEEVEEKQYDQYVEQVKARGFIEDAINQTSSGDKAYVAKSNENLQASLMYSIESKALIISVGSDQ